jgi:hypothetical protein
VACLLVLLVLAGCSGPVSVDAPSLSGSAARSCAALVTALPQRVADQSRRKTDTGGGYAAAWGDPAIELRCGVPAPAGLTPASACQTTDGVDWFIPESQITGRPTDVTMTTVGRSVNVEVRLPRDYFPPAAAMVDLARAVKRTTQEVRPCL